MFCLLCLGVSSSERCILDCIRIVSIHASINPQIEMNKIHDPFYRPAAVACLYVCSELLLHHEQYNTEKNFSISPFGKEQSSQFIKYKYC